MQNSFYSLYELNEIGFNKVGENVLISKKVSIYSPQDMSIGNNVRIDDFCILSGKLEIANYVHIACFTALFGGDKGIYIGSYSTLSSRVSVYAKTDDYSGEFMTNPMIPSCYTNVISSEVNIADFVIIGSGCVILPGANLKEGVACGALSLINKSLQPWSINVGIPARKIKDRSKELLKLRDEFIGE
ncbi:MAG: acyltransferase [Clostridiaceae bacterium]|nr:acyltransferase [Clostridiaceae bacterium]